MKKLSKKSALDKFLIRSKVAEIIEYLQENQIEELIMVFIDKDESIKLQGTTNLLESIGMFEVGLDIVNNAIWEDDENGKSKDEDGL